MDRRGSLLDDMLTRRLPLDYERMTAQEFNQLDSAQPQQVVALTGSVATRPGYHVMAPGDVYIRAHYEFDPAKPVFIDCARAPNAFACQSAAFELAVSGFKVIAVGLQHRHSGCALTE
jgi:hypothetical protein